MQAKQQQVDLLCRSIDRLTAGIQVEHQALDRHAVHFTKETITPGDGVNFPQQDQLVDVHITASLTDGTTVFSSRDPTSLNSGEPLVFWCPTRCQMEVKAGFDLDLLRMSIGEHAVVTCSPGSVYDSFVNCSGNYHAVPSLCDRPFGISSIRPDAIVKLDMELISIRSP